MYRYVFLLGHLCRCKVFRFDTDFVLVRFAGWDGRRLPVAVAWIYWRCIESSHVTLLYLFDSRGGTLSPKFGQWSGTWTSRMLPMPYSELVTSSLFQQAFSCSGKDNFDNSIRTLNSISSDLRHLGLSRNQVHSGIEALERRQKLTNG